jgi:hypothetical protein
VLLLGDAKDQAVRVDQFRLEDVVAAESVRPAEEAESAAQAVAGVADRRALPAGRGEPVRQSRLAGERVPVIGDPVEVAPAVAGTGGHRGVVDVEGDVLQLPQVKHETVVGEREAAGVVSTAAHGHRHPRHASEADGGDHVLRTPALAQHRRPSADPAVEHHAGALIGGVVRCEDGAVEAGAKR